MTSRKTRSSAGTCTATIIPGPGLLRDQLQDRIVDQGREKDFMRDGKLSNEVARSHTHEFPPYAV